MHGIPYINRSCIITLTCYYLKVLCDGHVFLDAYDVL